MQCTVHALKTFQKAKGGTMDTSHPTNKQHIGDVVEVAQWHSHAR